MLEMVYNWIKLWNAGVIAVQFEFLYKFLSHNMADTGLLKNEL